MQMMDFVEGEQPDGKQHTLYRPLNVSCPSVEVLSFCSLRVVGSSNPQSAREKFPRKAYFAVHALGVL
jgi:hypothetical protein